MSPSRLCDELHQARRDHAASSRPPPFKINKDSRSIHKSSASSSSSSSNSSTFASPLPGFAKIQSKSASSLLTTNHQQRQHPVIIYTHSPKVINIEPPNFMALVQKLTGLPNNNNPNSDHNHHQDHHHIILPHSRDYIKQRGSLSNSSSPDDISNIIISKIVMHNDNSSSSAVTDENSGGLFDNIQVNSSSVSLVPLNRSYDIPTFTPSSEFFFCSSGRSSFNRSYSEYGVLISSSPNIGTTGLIKGTGFPDY